MQTKPYTFDQLLTAIQDIKTMADEAIADDDLVTMRGFLIASEIELNLPDTSREDNEHALRGQFKHAVVRVLSATFGQLRAAAEHEIYTATKREG